MRSGFNVPLTSELTAGDVDVAERRFSFNFMDGQLITGDRVEFTRDQGATPPATPLPLDFVDGNTSDTITRWIHVDSMNGIRLYNDYVDAYQGDLENAIELATPSATYDILVQVQDDQFRCVGQVTDYELTTSRETIDLTVLGEEYRKQYMDGLIQGQGTLNCFWDYTKNICDENADLESEEPNYIAQLALRTQIGAGFYGRFFAHRHPTKSVWFETLCVITNASLAFSPTEAVRMSAQFISSGQIQMRFGAPPGDLLTDPLGFRLMQGSNLNATPPVPSPGAILVTGP